MTLDLRLPLGLLFAVLGLLLAFYGLVSDAAIYQASSGVNVNLWTGAAMLAFGALMLIGVWRGAAPHDAD
jgi:hypothetical protein